VTLEYTTVAEYGERWKAVPILMDMQENIRDQVEHYDPEQELIIVFQMRGYGNAIRVQLHPGYEFCLKQAPRFDPVATLSLRMDLTEVEAAAALKLKQEDERKLMAAGTMMDYDDDN
jgi:hypothetical protein